MRSSSSGAPQAHGDRLPAAPVLTDSRAVPAVQHAQLVPRDMRHVVVVPGKPGLTVGIWFTRGGLLELERHPGAAVVDGVGTVALERPRHDAFAPAHVGNR